MTAAGPCHPGIARQAPSSPRAAAQRIARAATEFRRSGLPVTHIRHSDPNPLSPLHAASDLNLPLPCAEALEGEPVFIKSTTSAFASTDLGPYLHERGITDLFVTGAVAGFCVNSTERRGADLGFKMYVLHDAVIGFDLAGLSAKVIFDVTMAHLDADFAGLLNSGDLPTAKPQLSEQDGLQAL